MHWLIWFWFYWFFPRAFMVLRSAWDSLIVSSAVELTFSQVNPLFLHVKYISFDIEMILVLNFFQQNLSLFYHLTEVCKVFFFKGKSKSIPFLTRRKDYNGKKFKLIKNVKFVVSFSYSKIFVKNKLGTELFIAEKTLHASVRFFIFFYLFVFVSFK